MKIIQNFSSRKHIKEFPIVDTLIWYVGALKLKELGYKLKLYCEKKDYKFLKQWGLIDLYDEIDDTFLSRSSIIKKVNGEKFWSVRKIECINHEFNTSTEPFMYFDTDIVYQGIPQLDGDLLIWSLELKEPIYIPFEFMSMPEGKFLPNYILNTAGAYNCGVLWFKDKKVFKEYRKQYLNFTVGNPCICNAQTDDPNFFNVMWACNAEQRILKAVAEYKHLQVSYLCEEDDKGISDFGIHYYVLRSIWRRIFDPKMTSEDNEFAIKTLNEQILQLLSILEILDKQAFERFMSVDWLNGIYKQENLALKYQ